MEASFDYMGWVAFNWRTRPWTKKWPKWADKFEPSICLAWWGQNVLPLYQVREHAGLADPNVVVRELRKLETNHPRIVAWIGHKPLEKAISFGWWEVAKILVHWLERRSDMWTCGTFEHAHNRNDEDLESDRVFREIYSREFLETNQDQLTGSWRRTFPHQRIFFIGDTRPMQFHPLLESIDWFLTRNAFNVTLLWKEIDQDNRLSAGLDVFVRVFVASESWWSSAEQMSFEHPDFYHQMGVVAHIDANASTDFSSQKQTIEFTFDALSLPENSYSSVVYHTKRTTCNRCSSVSSWKPRSLFGFYGFLATAAEIRRNRLRGAFFAVIRLLQLRIRNAWLRPDTGKWYRLALMNFTRHQSS